MDWRRGLCILICLSIPSAQASPFSALESLVRTTAGVPGNLLGGLTGFLFGPAISRASASAAAPFRQAALDVLAELDAIAEKNIASSNQAVMERLTQLDTLVGDALGDVNATVEEIDAKLALNLQRIEDLEEKVFQDVLEVIAAVNETIADADCRVQGLSVGLQLVIDEYGDRIRRGLSLGEKFKIFIDRLRGKPSEQPSYTPSEAYRALRDTQLAKLGPDTKIEEVLFTYTDLQYLAHSYYCLHREVEGRELYARDIINFERSFDTWFSLTAL